MRKKLVYCFCFLVLLVLIIVLAKSYICSRETDELVKIYYTGGVISGIFAFGAFFVAVWANRTQNKTGNLQRFETTFFNMLNLQQQITNDLVFHENVSDDGN